MDGKNNGRNKTQIGSVPPSSSPPLKCRLVRAAAAAGRNNMAAGGKSE